MKSQIEKVIQKNKLADRNSSLQQVTMYKKHRADKSFREFGALKNHSCSIDRKVALEALQFLIQSR